MTLELVIRVSNGLTYAALKLETELTSLIRLPIEMLKPFLFRAFSSIFSEPILPVLRFSSCDKIQIYRCGAIIQALSKPFPLHTHKLDRLNVMNYEVATIFSRNPDRASSRGCGWRVRWITLSVVAPELGKTDRVAGNN